MRKQTLISAALLAALSLSTAAFAQPPGPGPDGPEGVDGPAGPGGPGGHRHHGGPLREELRQLDLSEAQKSSIKQIVQPARQQMRAQMEALREQHKAFETAIPGSAAYQNAVGSLAQAEANAASARVQQQASIRTQVYALLTDAQKTQLATLIAQREARHEAKLSQWQAQHPAPEPSNE